MIKHFKLATLLIAVFGLFAISMPAHAETGDGACKDDVKKLCGDVKPGDGGIRDCMKAHASEVSQGCKDNMAAMKAKFEAQRKEIEAACKADIKQFCANVTPGEGREMACLKSYEDKVSAGCKAALPKMGMHKGMRHHGDKDKGGDQGPDNGSADQVPSQPEGK